MKKWIVSALISLASTTASAEDKPLNILFILTDDQAADTVHAFGNERISTPNIDSLAREGMTFTHVFNQGSWSGAVCAPSRRMINTGRHLFHTGMGPDDAKDGSDADGIKLFGETFRDEGYTTFMTGKWHLPMSIWERSFTHGKAIFKGGMSYKEKGGQWHATFSDYDASAKQEDRFAEYTGDKHTSELIADAAVDFLSGKADDPFMMYVAFLAPHDPRQSPDDYVARYKGETIDLPANYMPEHPFDQGDHFIRDEILAPFPREPEVVKSFIGEYYAMIEHVDTQIGRVLNALEASGQAENTLVIFTSDHGLAVGRHGLLGKQNQYDHSVRVPFILKGPGVPKAAKAPGMFYLNSIFPTAADMAGIKVPATVQALTIAPLVRGEKPTLYSSIYSSYRHYQRMLRTEDYKLIYYPVIKKTQLFDMKADENELHNLAGKAEHTSRIEDMMQQLEDWKKVVDDPLRNDAVEMSFAPMGGTGERDHRPSETR